MGLSASQRIIEERLQLIPPRILPLVERERVPVETARLDTAGAADSPPAPHQAHYRAVMPGEPWGTLWSTTWFRIRGKVPPSWRGRRVVCFCDLGASGQEGFTAEALCTIGGEARLAWNVNRRSLPIFSKARAGATVEIFLEAAANATPDHFPEGFDPDNPAALQRELFRFGGAFLAAVDEEALWFHRDFTAAVGAMRALPENGQRRATLRSVLNRAANAFDPDNPSTIPRAAGILRPALAPKNGPGAHRVIGVGHAHIDTAWLWTAGEAMRKCARTFASATANMARYPQFRMACPQALHLAWMKDKYPSIYSRILDAAKRGQWEPTGSMWVEPDCNMPSGESLVRQILHGKRFFLREFGVETRDAWLPDSFGFPASLPQILKLAGIDWFMTQKLSWNETNDFPHTSFWWEGIDGSRVLAHCPPCATYNAFPDAQSLLASEERHKNKEASAISLMPFGYGDGGGGPSADMIESGQRLANFAGLPTFEFGSVREFFEALEKSAEELPTWHGEMLLETHRGVFTSQGRMKRWNRKAEALLCEAEFADAITSSLIPGRREKPVNPERAACETEGNEPPGTFSHALGRAWRLVLQNQFHDILPGTSIGAVYRDAERDFSTVAEISHSIIDTSVAALGKAIDTSSYKRPFFAGNPLGFRRREVLDLPGGGACLVDVPPCGYAVIEAEQSGHIAHCQPVGARRTRAGWTLQNGLLQLRIDRDGHLASLRDLENAREVLAHGGKANVLQLFRDRPNRYDAWNVEPFDRATHETVGGLESIELIEEGPLRCTLRTRRSFGNSSLTQDIVLAAGSRRIDFHTEAEWHESHRLLKVAFPLAINAARAVYEIPFGTVERPTHSNTSWDEAQFEVPAFRWAELAEPGYGVALLNDCRPGYDIAGRTMRLSLLRSPRSPDPAADKGHHTFSYALFPHAGSWKDAGVDREAAFFNTPLRAREFKVSPGHLPARASFFSVEPEGLSISCVKRSEDGGATVVRLYEPQGARGTAVLRTSLPFSKVAPADLLERQTGNPQKLLDGALRVEFKPFQILTYLFLP